KGIKSFKTGMTEDEEAEAQRRIEAQRRLDSAPRGDLSEPPRTTTTAEPVDRREP
ncbi:MAG: hypothetical protein QOH86_1578, partial [Sphingomonadales bacterium]|nr:hypothetical protein [Sphingomonadales bacterium]